MVTTSRKIGKTTFLEHDQKSSVGAENANIAIRLASVLSVFATVPSDSMYRLTCFGLYALTGTPALNRAMEFYSQKLPHLLISPPKNGDENSAPTGILFAGIEFNTTSV